MVTRRPPSGARGESPAKARRRAAGPTGQLVIDLVAQAWLSRSWLVLVLLLVSILAAASLFVGQNVVPFAIYPAL